MRKRDLKNLAFGKGFNALYILPVVPELQSHSRRSRSLREKQRMLITHMMSLVGKKILSVEVSSTVNGCGEDVHIYRFWRS